MLFRVKELRESRGLTQVELAERSGVSRGTICALESGQEKTVTTSTLLKLASVLGVSFDALFYTQDAQ